MGLRYCCAHPETRYIAHGVKVAFDGFALQVTYKGAVGVISATRGDVIAIVADKEVRLSVYDGNKKRPPTVLQYGKRQNKNNTP